MTCRLSIRRRAADDLVAARDWYNEQAEGLGEKFFGRVEQVFERLVKAPQRFPLVTDDVRKHQCSVFLTRYSSEFAAIQLVSSQSFTKIVHQNRDPELVARRLNQ